MDLIGIVNLALTLLLAVGIFCGRYWLKAKVEAGVKHDFDEKIEGVKTEFRKKEEVFKSEMRAREVELSTLRDAVFSGRATRQSLLDKRKIEAVEKLWESLVALAPYKAISSQMAVIDIEVAAKGVVRNPKLRKFFEMVGGTIAAPPPSYIHADNERIFVSPLAWAYFSAYRSVVTTAYATAKLLEIGVEDSTKLLNHCVVSDLLKAALPHQAPIIDQYKSAAHHHLLDELEQKLMTELQKTLEGKEADQANIDRAAEILGKINKINEENPSMANT